ncbi:hypothetical protein [Lyngbya confervoides]|uniref:CRISPR-associated protein Cas6-like N-terminal domain-containing protein n=1 Tax=Lyngbya confervoides BDU141951 TaxID=1574623 RepID=A0ABD4T355_9CYAN|nr:hypothetical protein [Lyngbya confervoides]MCM1983103.1 hypothetical protein [Lyngbya confervoides BDU141951]
MPTPPGFSSGKHLHTPFLNLVSSVDHAIRQTLSPLSGGWVFYPSTFPGQIPSDAPLVSRVNSTPYGKPASSRDVCRLLMQCF